MKFILKALLSAVAGLLVIYGVHSMWLRWRDRQFNAAEELRHAQAVARDTSHALKEFVVEQGARLTNATAYVRIESSAPPGNTGDESTDVADDRKRLRRLLDTVRKSQIVLQQEGQQP